MKKYTHLDKKMIKHYKYQPEYVQLSVLPIIFGLSETFFTECKNSGLLKEGVHYFYPKSKSINSKSSKRAMVWDIDAIRRFIRANPDISDDEELNELINR
jgi:hypothetical protein